MSYLKSVFLMKDKEVFDVTKLDTEKYSRYVFMEKRESRPVFRWGHYGQCICQLSVRHYFRNIRLIHRCPLSGTNLYLCLFTLICIYIGIKLHRAIVLVNLLK